MHAQTFTNGSDRFVVRDAETYLLDFLDGNDQLGIATSATGSFTTAYMGAGDDQVLARGGDGRLFGQAGNDRMDLYADGFVARGGIGSDRFYLAGDNLYVEGGEGKDLINFKGDSANATAFGGANRDFFVGRFVISGDMHGGDGNDKFIGFANSGDNVVNLYGGAGKDVYKLTGTNQANVFEEFGEGRDKIVVARGVSYTLGANIERLSAAQLRGSSDADATLTGNDLSNLIIGQSNNETVFGRAGDDNIYGQGGNDRLHGGSGNDALRGGRGNDILTGSSGNDRLLGATGDDRMRGESGNDIYHVDSLADRVVENAAEGFDEVRVTVDGYRLTDNVEKGVIASSAGLRLEGNALDNTLVGGAGDDSLFGHDGNDFIRGERGNDTIDGGDGNDRLYGQNGNDVIEGGNGDDRLFGGDGDDFLCGGPGQDQLNGGAGNDTICSEGTAVVTGGLGNDSFLFDALITGAVNILDFNVVEDTVLLDVEVFSDLVGLVNPDGTLLEGSFVEGTVALDLDDRIIFDATTGNIFFDPDGSGLESQILFAQVQVGTPLTNVDFVLGG